ncbi:MAG: nitroreductase family protein [Thermoflexaceae bacterium]|nr:nitroreductase family protein [Thermoflexaceae bacterium]
MEFKEVVGWRRSIRFFAPWRPVEREKVQAILEAVYRAPKVLELDIVRCVVIYRDALTAEQLESIRSPINSAQIDMAPVYIQFFADLQAAERAMDGGHLKELIDLDLLPASFGWTHDYVDRVIVPQVYKRILTDSNRVVVGRRPPLLQEVEEQAQARAGGGRTVVAVEAEPATLPLSLLVLANTAVGIAQAHALLSAFDEGLGAHLCGISPVVMKQLCRIPDYWHTGASTMLLGYHAGSWEDGGQRPREPFEEDFFEGRYGTPFVQDPGVVGRLKAERMIQDEAPLAWRRGELSALADMLGLPK